MRVIMNKLVKLTTLDKPMNKKMEPPNIILLMSESGAPYYTLGFFQFGLKAF